MPIIQMLQTIIQNSYFIAIGIIGLGFLIGFHEFGHFIFCKIFGIATPTFSIGMGPVIYKKKIGQTEFALSAIPLGGYVEVAGLAEVGQGDQKESHATGQYSFATKPYWQKFLVMFGGILFNIIFAFLAISGLYYLGMPKTPILYPINASTTISMVDPDSPAQQAGLQPHDIITAIDGTPVSMAEDLIGFIQKNPNKTIKLAFTRNQQQEEISLQLGSKEINQQAFGFLGVEFEIPRYGIMQALKNGWNATIYLIKQIFHGFKSIFIRKQFNNLGGPIMIIAQTVKGAAAGLKLFLLFLAFISINLAILNIFPLPILDGGQILFFTIEAIVRRPLPIQVREYIHYATWILMLLLFVFLSIKDIIRLVWH